MLYYLGKGTEFKKEECKEYKTLKNALAAAAKDETLTVWDENGKIVGGLTDNVPEGALKTNPDGSVPAFDENGHPVGTVDAATVAELTGENAETATEEQNGAKPEKNTPETETGENGYGNCDGQQDGQNASGEGAETTPDETFKVTVVCIGSIRLRRAPSWDAVSVCGKAVAGQSYIGKRIFVLDGRPMIETIDGLFISAAPEHVKIEQ